MENKKVSLASVLELTGQYKLRCTSLSDLLLIANLEKDIVTLGESVGLKLLPSVVVVEKDLSLCNSRVHVLGEHLSRSQLERLRSNANKPKNSPDLPARDARIRFKVDNEGNYILGHAQYALVNDIRDLVKRTGCVKAPKISKLADDLGFLTLSSLTSVLRRLLVGLDLHSTQELFEVVTNSSIRFVEKTQPKKNIVETKE